MCLQRRQMNRIGSCFEQKPPSNPSGHVSRPTGRGDSQNIQEQVQANELV